MWPSASRRFSPDDPSGPAPGPEAALAPFFEERGELASGPESRFHQWTTLRPTGTRQWAVTQTLLDSEGDTAWAVFAEIDLRDETAPDGPILRLTRIGT